MSHEIRYTRLQLSYEGTTSEGTKSRFHFYTFAGGLDRTIYLQCATSYYYSMMILHLALTFSNITTLITITADRKNWSVLFNF